MRRRVGEQWQPPAVILLRSDAPPISNAHVAALEADDYVVIDGLFPALTSSSSAGRRIPQNHAIGSIRTDRVLWITEEDGIVGDTVRAQGLDRRAGRGLSA